MHAIFERDEERMRRLLAPQPIVQVTLVPPRGDMLEPAVEEELNETLD
jgi:hypothetical protein